MTPKAWIIFIATSLMWGSSFMFAKVAVEGFTAMQVAVFRCAAGFLVLVAFDALLKSRLLSGSSLRKKLCDDAVFAPPADWNQRMLMLAMGLTIAIPFFLVAWAVKSVDSGIAGIVNATVPLWSTAIAFHVDKNDKPDLRRILGVCIGFSGVVLLMARDTTTGITDTLPYFAILFAALLYAVNANGTRALLHGVAPMRLARWSCGAPTAIFIVPALLIHPPMDVAGKSWFSLAMLGVFATAGGMILYYILLSLVGAQRASLVNYALPLLAVVYGALLLSESITVNMLFAIALLLGGIWLGSRGRSEREPSGV